MKFSIHPQFVHDLRSWWDPERRDLPWRHTRDPWAVLVSEVMSQQTQVERVIPKWIEFLERYPTPEALAEAELGDVIALWVGLGYNRRARMLYQCAKDVVRLHSGLVPDELEALMALPGIGPYTARAVLAFAFEADTAVVDTNVGRLLARLSGETLTPSRAQQLGDSLVPAGDGWAWNQAVLDFGASVCTKRSPQCEACPVRTRCSWRGVGVDPATGSAGVTKVQSSFAGSDREGRGRLIKALASGQVACGEVAGAMGWPDDPERARRVLNDLIGEGMAVQDGDFVRLP